MKNRIAKRLILSFTAVLLVFSLVIGCFFWMLFSRHTVELGKEDLVKRATHIAGTISEALDDTPDGKSGPWVGRLTTYLNLLDYVAMSDVWLVDTRFQVITRGLGGTDILYSQLPPDGERIVKEALAGEISFSEGFSNMLGTHSLTVGAPVWDSSGRIVAAVLLHAPLQGLKDVVTDGLGVLLVSIGAALVLSVGLSITMSLRFIRPLRQMEEVARRLTEGDYTAKTGVDQADEIGVLAHSMDILAMRLEEASQESEKLEQMRQEFISNISHELRTPVTVMRSSAEALCDGVVTETGKIAAYHHQMLAESIHLQRLVNDLLELTRLQNTDFSIEKSWLNLRELVEDAARAIRRLADRKQVNVVQQQGEGSFGFEGDYARLRQMLLAVLDNGVKFSSPGQTVGIALEQREGSIQIRITDQGRGISAEELPAIFERFHKLHTAGNTTGTGLGLPIAKQIADRHGIAIHVSSTQNGTEFLFVF